MVDFLRFRDRTVRGSLELSVVLFVAGACTSEGSFFNEPPPARAGRGGAAGAAGIGGRSAGGGAGTSAAGSSSAGVTGSGGNGVGAATGSGGGGGTGGRSGTGGGSGGEAGAAGGESAVGGSAGTGGVAASAGMGGSVAGSGAGGQGGTAGGGTAGLGEAGDPGTAGMGGEPCVAHKEICDGVNNDCDEFTDEEGCPEGCEGKTRGGHVYMLCMTTDEDLQFAYNGASNYCQNAQELLELDFFLALAKLDDDDETEFAKAWVRARTTMAGMVWIGANDIDQENKWVWGRGDTAVQFFTANPQGGGMPYQGAFNDWAVDRPNSSNGSDEDCGAMDAEFDWQWNDIACDNKRLGLLCEQSP